MAQLLSYPSLVEAPFIIVEIGGYTFGDYKGRDKFGGMVSFPDCMMGINVTKINGKLNTYTIRMSYHITFGDDPNKLDKIFSKNKDIYGWQKIKISYGDWSCPSFIFKEEEAIVTKITSNVDFSGSKIDYTLSCTSTSLPIMTNSFNFPALEAKPSDILLNVMTDKLYGVQNIFAGIKSKQQILSKGLIPTNDKKVRIEAKDGVSVLDYMNYLVNCMSNSNDSNDTIIKNSKYFLSIEDDYSGKVGGPYIKVTEIAANDTSDISNPDVYTIDVGYPGNNFVTNFTINNNDIWSIYYNYSKDVPESNYVYRIDNDGKLVTEYSPSISRSKIYKYTTEVSKTWWTSMTEFPITAVITIKGLLKPSVLMDKVRINSYFYGQKHISSGLYIIIKQEDAVDASGYRTNLTLTRIGADTI